MESNRPVSAPPVGSPSGPPLGALLIALGVLLNRAALQAVLARDGLIESPTTRLAIVACQAGLLTAGGALLLSPAVRARARPRWWLASALVLVALLANLRAFDLLGPTNRLDLAVRRMVATEDRLLALKLELRPLQRALLDLDLPGEPARPAFAQQVSVVDLALPPEPWRQLGAVQRASLDLASATPRPVSRDALSLFGALFERVAWIRHAAFKLVSGELHGARDDYFVGQVALHALCREQQPGWLSLSAGLELTWHAADPDAPDGRWELVGFAVRSVELARAPRLLFAELLDQALPEAAARRAARTSEHQQQVLASYVDPDFEPPYPHWSRPAFDRHPGLAVTDLEGDGDDDLYLAVRRGRNQLFVNRGTGVFDERAADWGIDLPGDTNAALFADLDDDGDPDLLLGRGLSPSRLLEQRDSQFVEGAGLLAGELPALVSSIAAADVDLDGRLDLYLCTYAAEMLREEWDGERVPDHPLAEFLPDSDVGALRAALAEADARPYRNAPGPPNVLLRAGADGRLLRDDGVGLALLRNTYQAGFSDVDQDGDPDLYCANDFAPNTLLRNDGGRFTDITQASGSAAVGFGMGVSFGDIDLDGDPDLYVSNMDSTAGRRMTAALPGLDPQLAAMARGNALLRNDGVSFTRVSGSSEGELHVERAGWSWGGQLCDFDADGRLDVAVASGYETAPEPVRGLVDR